MTHLSRTGCLEKGTSFLDEEQWPDSLGGALSALKLEDLYRVLEYQMGLNEGQMTRVRVNRRGGATVSKTQHDSEILEILNSLSCSVSQIPFSDFVPISLRSGGDTWGTCHAPGVAEVFQSPCKLRWAVQILEGILLTLSGIKSLLGQHKPSALWTLEGR